MAFRVAVAGLGTRGREWVQTLRATAGMELVACVETDEAILGRSARTLALPSSQCFRRLDEALDRVPCQALIVATSMHRHVEPCRMAIARGLGVLVEKPFTLDLGEAAALVAEAEKQKVPIVVGQNYRYTRALRTTRRLLAAGALGRIGKFVCRVYRGAEPAQAPAVVGVPDGLCWELAVHHLDALRYLFGEPHRVLARITTPAWDGARHRSSVEMLLSFDDGPMGLFEALYDSRGHEFFEGGREHYLRVGGEAGTLHVLNRWLLWCARGKLPRFVRRGRRPEPEEALLLRQLLESLRTGAEPECSGRDNLKTLTLLEAGLRSAATGRWVEPAQPPVAVT